MIIPGNGISPGIVLQDIVQDADTGGTPGIDCDRPRYTTGGKLILGTDGGWRARCEADRVTALNYASIVRETRDTLRTALDNIPQPLWDHFVVHLMNKSVSEWSWPTDDDGNPIDPIDNNRKILAGTGPEGRAIYWAAGILDKTSMFSDWHGKVHVRTCGVTAGIGRPEIARGASILIWLEPANMGARWTTRMVQRTVRTHFERVEGRGAMSNYIPDVLDENRKKLIDANGNSKDLSTDLLACIDRNGEIPKGALVMQVPLSYSTVREDEMYPCTGSDKVGVQKLRRERHNGLYIVPVGAVLADGVTPHPQRGMPLLKEFDNVSERPVVAPGESGPGSSDYPITDPVHATFLVKACRDPITRDFTRDGELRRGFE